MMWARLRSWWQGAFGRARVERDLADELEFHVTSRTEYWEQQGLSAREAARRARLEFGGVENYKEQCREARGLRFIDELRGDVRYGVRQMRAAPTLSGIAVAIFAIGIGGNAAVFSVLEAALWRVLPVERPQELRELAWTMPRSSSSGGGFSGWYNGSMRPYAGGGLVATSFAYPVYAHVRDKSTAFSDLFLFDRHDRINVGVGGRAAVASALLVSGNFFRGLGVDTVIGRPIIPDDDRAGAAGVAVLTHGCWQRLFGGDPRAIGQTITINGAPAVVVGIAPPAFYGVEPGRPVDVLAPIATMVPVFYDVANMLASPRHWAFRVMGRVNENARDDQVRLETEALVRQAIAAEQHRITGVVVNPAAQGLDSLRRNYAQPLGLLMAIAVAVLLVACANIAGLLLTRVMARQREMAVRLALGAGRVRLMRQVLVESVVLAAMGGALGFVLALLVRNNLLPLLNQDEEPLEVALGLNPWLLTFACVLCLVVGLLCGMLPALRGSQTAARPLLTAAGSAGAKTASRLFAGKTLIATQVALSMVLLVGAGLFARTLMNLRSEALGFRPEAVLLFRLDATLSGYKDTRLLDLYETALERVTALPGVRSASLARYGLLSGGATTDTIVIPGAPQGRNELHVHLHYIAPRYFETMGIPLRLGREFTPADREGAPRVAVVNQTLAHRLAQLGVPAQSTNSEYQLGTAGTSPVGQRIHYGERSDPDTEIVGVAGDARFATLREPAPPTLYLPYRQHGQHQVTFAVHTAGEPAALASTVRRTLAELDSNVPLLDVVTQVEQIDRAVRQERIFAQLVSAVALLAVLLASLGIYGTLAYSVARRTPEIGVRVALGATRRDVVRMVLRESLAPVTVGITLGVGGAVATTRFIESMLFGLTPRDTPTLLFSVLALAGSALVAAWLPSRRAARLDPMSALRCE